VNKAEFVSNKAERILRHELLAEQLCPRRPVPMSPHPRVSVSARLRVPHPSSLILQQNAAGDLSITCGFRAEVTPRQ